MPKGIFGSYSAILDSIPFSISSGKRAGRNGSSPASSSPEKPAPCPAPQPLHPQQDQHVHTTPCFYPHVSGAEASLFLAELHKAHPTGSCSARSLQPSSLLLSSGQTQTWELPLLRAWRTQQNRGSPPPRLCPWACRSAQLAGFSSWMSIHVGAKQASTLPAVHCKGKGRRRRHEAGKARMTCLGPSMAVSQPAECASGCSWSHPTVWAGGDVQQSPKGLLQGRGPGDTH